LYVPKHTPIQADPFVLSKLEVSHAVKDYLVQEGYEIRNLDDFSGIDLVAANEYHTLMIEVLGNYEDNQEYSVEFTDKQLDTYFSTQVVTLLKNYEKNPGKTLVIAVADTPRIRNKAEAIKSALDELGIVRFWVKKDFSIEWD
jgi:hypothetical protein